MKKLVTVLALLVGLTTGGSAIAAPGGQGPFRPTIVSKQFCPVGTQVAYVTQYGLTADDYGVINNVWASDSYRRVISIIRVAPGTFCAATNESGSFSAYTGLSPDLTGVVLSGTSGSIGGGMRTNVFTATWSPQVATSGTIPATQDWLSLFFTNVQGYGVNWWSYGYYTSAHGTWANRADYSYGDITG